MNSIDSPIDWKFLLKLLLIAAAVAFIYAPAVHGDWLWDDDIDITTNHIIQSPAGLWPIWFEPGTQLDYYPIKATVQWMQWHLWGRDTLGYHLTNILLHLGSALLVWRLFAKLNLRYAWLGGLLFAIHPVMVESVAWIAELKNTLSLPPFLLAMIAWIDFENRGRRSDYVLALGFFLTALLCKTTMVMFPFVILLYSWWRRDRIDVTDLKRSAPFFLCSLILGWVTINCPHWCATYYHHPQDATDLGGAIPRVMLVGSSLAFYFIQCIFPLGLLPVYPQWPINAPSFRGTLPWLGFAGILYLCWRHRAGRGRHLLLGLVFFILILLPVLGFKSATYMAFTWVMDHFLYIPIIGVIGLVVAGLGELEPRLSSRMRLGGFFVLAALLMIMTVGSHLYARLFINQATLWAYTVRYNPQAWPARNNLGLTLVLSHRYPEAMEQFDGVLKIKPDYISSLRNRGHLRQIMGDSKGALIDLNRVLAYDPHDAQAHQQRAIVRMGYGDFAGAIDDLRQFRTVAPGDPNADYALLWIWICQSSIGQQALADQELTAACETDWHHGRTEWPSQNVRFILGRQNEAAYLASAVSPDPTKDREQHCEAWYYAGIKRLLAGDQKTAVDYFHQCLDTQVADFIEYSLARGELQRLESKP